MPTTIRELLARPCTARKPGLSGYKIDRCRCSVCTAANREHQRGRDKAIGYGTWQPLVDAEPVRAHLRALSEAGIGLKQAARLAGVSSGTVSNLMYGKTNSDGRVRPASKRCRPHIAAKLLAVQVDRDRLTDASTIPAVGTQRRVQALAAAGWSIAAQAARVGRTTANYGYLLTAQSVTVRTARQVAALYDDLTGTAPVGPVAKKTRAWARRNGWHGAGAWDDATINDPAALPVTDLPKVEVVDEVAVERVHAGTYAFGDLTAAEQVELFRRYRHTAGGGTLCRRWNISTATFRRLERAAEQRAAAA